MLSLRLLFCIPLIWVRLCSSSSSTKSAKLDTLKFVHVIFRHGDRAPLNTFPSDTGNNETTWSMGWGQMTQLGMRQNYDLGRWLRARYDGFISKTYSSREVYVRSTDFDRTILSAMATMAGLYAVDSNRPSQDAIVFQPIPIHSRPQEDDPMLYTLTDCPTATKLSAMLQNSEEVKEIEDENAEFLKFLSIKTGLEKRITLLYDIRSIHDALKIERLHRYPSVDDKGHECPTWVNGTVWKQIVKLNNLATKYRFYTAELQRLGGGLLLGDILERMKNKTREYNSQKVYAYSAHDWTMSAFLANLGYLTDQQPSYSSALLIELHEKDQQQIVDVYYKHETNSVEDLETINVSDCLRPCSLFQFAKRSQNRIPEDWYSECGRRNDQK